MPETRKQSSRPQDLKSCVRLMNLNEAAQYLGVSYWTVRDLVASGNLPRVRLPSAHTGRDLRRTLIDQRDLDALIEAQKDIDPE